MGNYENIFEKVGKARILNNWQSNVPQGKHRLALVKYGGKESSKDHTVFLEAEFVVLESNNPEVKPGARHSWPWFVNKPDEFGYTHSRAKNFLEVLQACIGNESDVTRFGDDLAEDFASAAPEAYGLTLNAHVDQVFTVKGEPRYGKKGQEIFNVTWIPVPQSAEDIANTRSLLEELARRDAARTAAPPPSPPPSTSQASRSDDPTPAKNRLGGLGALLGRPR